MAVSIRPHGVNASCLQGSKNIRKHHVTALKIYKKIRKKRKKEAEKKYSICHFSHLPFFLDVPGTVIVGLSWELLFVSLEGQGVEYLQCHAKVYWPKNAKLFELCFRTFHILPDKIVDVFIPNIMTKNQKSILDPLCSRKWIYQMSKKILASFWSFVIFHLI